MRLNVYGAAAHCSHLNAYGAVAHCSHLNVYGPPLIRPFPASGLRAVEGRASVVHCPVAGFGEGWETRPE